MATPIRYDIVWVDVWRPASRTAATIYDAGLIVLGSVSIAALAQLALPLPWTPVPITGQTLGVLLCGALLGSWRGGIATVLYLAEGAAGLPVFAGGAAGWLHLCGPTAGYLWGFVLAALATGWLAERGWTRRLLSTAAAMAVGNAGIYLLGLPWLALFTGWDRVVWAGLLPFIPGDGCKLLLATLLLPSLERLGR